MNALQASRKVDLISDKIECLKFSYRVVREKCDDVQVDKTLSVLTQTIVDLEGEHRFLIDQLVNVELRRRDE